MKFGGWLALIAVGSCARGTDAANAATQSSGAKASAASLDAPARRAAAKPPTLAEVPYGDHPRQVLDFWRVESATPTPLLFFIHGGGWVASSKSDVVNLGRLSEYLNAGISVVSINYRLVTQALDAGVKPPVQWPLHDAARALQFVRSKAGQWNIDKTRIAATGFSAGACSSLWLAFHADLADPRSADPVARESTRLFCAGVNIAQTTLDPRQMKEWTPNSRYGGHAFGFMPDPKNLKTRDSQFAQFLAARDQILPWIEEFSPFGWVSADDPPIYLSYRTPPALGHDDKDPTHTANFGVKLAEKLQSVGVECELVYPGLQDVKHAQTHEYLVNRLKGRR
ncbi:MAG: alpha/beta hydrolase [Verrucomicrobia bacterium]|nr:alpha/beta hydrolase [Verrucomicrobiota bacterium]